MLDGSGHWVLPTALSQGQLGPLGTVEGKNLKGLGADDSAAVFCC